jgi:hypothetical protein
LLPTDDVTDTTVAVRRELARLTREGNGTLAPAAVLEAARSPKSPLHGYFEWDDALAGEAYRLAQARALIRGVRVSMVVEQTTYRVPVYVHTVLEQGEVGYRELLGIQGDAQKLRVISREMRMGMAHLSRAGNIASAIDNPRLHAALLREVSRIERYLKTLGSPDSVGVRR